MASYFANVFPKMISSNIEQVQDSVNIQNNFDKKILLKKSGVHANRNDFEPKLFEQVRILCSLWPLAPNQPRRHREHKT